MKDFVYSNSIIELEKILLIYSSKKQSQYQLISNSNNYPLKVRKSHLYSAGNLRKTIIWSGLIKAIEKVYFRHVFV